MKVLRRLAIAYAATLGLVALWAWWVEIQFLNSPREHLLPAAVLAFLSLPSSLSVGGLYDAWPELLSRPFGQLAWLTLCGAAQAFALFLVSGFGWRTGRDKVERRR